MHIPAQSASNRSVARPTEATVAPRQQPPDEANAGLHSCAKHGIDHERRRQLIAETAYHLAECRGFAPGYELADWLEAERQFEPMFEGVHFCGD